jgi:hypothetical protein
MTISPASANMDMISRLSAIVLDSVDIGHTPGVVAGTGVGFFFPIDTAHLARFETRETILRT